MPKRRRPARPVRRPNFRPAPEPTESETPPSFADEPVTVPALGATAPIETRPHWNARTDRVQGRRLQQLRRSSGEGRAVPRMASAGQLPVLERAYIMTELKRILIISAALTGVVIFLALISD